MNISEDLQKIKEPYLLTIPVLDKGFCRLVDFMGDDSRIVQSARVSYGEGTKTVREDKGLIDYLLRHRHTSPFEQVKFAFHVKLPIFVARQLVRHRTACLSGDTQLWFDEPSAIKNGTRKRHNVKISDLYKRWHEGFVSVYNPKRTDTYINNIDADKIYTVPELSKAVHRREEQIRHCLQSGKLKGFKKQTQSMQDCSWQILGQSWIDYANQERIWANDSKNVLSKMNLRMCDEETGKILHTHIKDIWSNGVKDVFEIELENGYKIKMTKDHLCFSEDGWGTLEHLVKLNTNGANCTWSSKSPAFCVNGIPVYQDFNWMLSKRSAGLDVQATADEAGCSYHTIRKWLKIHKLCFTAKEKSKLSGAVQKGTKRTKGRYVVSEQTKQKIKLARSGEKSNFWKGGVSSDREGIGRWTTQISPEVHKKYNYECQICKDNYKLNAHHIDPVWHNIHLSKSFDNLITLCESCHKFVHKNNLELKFLDLVKEDKPLSTLLGENKEKRQYKTGSAKLLRTFSNVKNIKYIGQEEVFDIEVDGPYHNFIANGFIVHNSLNEISGRYSVMTDEFYVPTQPRMQKQSSNNKQGSSSEMIDNAFPVILKMKDEQKMSYDHYLDYLDEGLAKELSRINLPLSTYTEWYWTMDLHNLFHFLKLRMDSHAQWEIREFANAKYELIKPIVPYACESFERHILNGRAFSGDEMEIIKSLINKNTITDQMKELGWKQSQIDEFIAKI